MTGYCKDCGTKIIGKGVLCLRCWKIKNNFKRDFNLIDLRLHTMYCRRKFCIFLPDHDKINASRNKKFFPGLTVYYLYYKDIPMPNKDFR